MSTARYADSTGGPLESARLAAKLVNQFNRLIDSLSKTDRRIINGETMEPALCTKRDYRRVQEQAAVGLPNAF